MIAKFGRYKHGRPHGLHIDSEGAFLLSNLMSVWGNSKTITEGDVLSEVIKNAKRQDGGPRFTVKMVHAGDYKIWVHESRGSFAGRSGVAAAKRSWPRRNHRSGSSGSRTAAAKRGTGALGADAWELQADAGVLGADAEALEADAEELEADAGVLEADAGVLGADEDHEADAGVLEASAEEHEADAGVREADAEVLDTDAGGVIDAKAAVKSGAYVKGRPPKNPPGRHWQMYNDVGTYWWYYDGPKGKWWIGPGHDKPEPLPIKVGPSVKHVTVRPSVKPVVID